MSIYRKKRSPYYHFDFSIKGYRFSGSTGCASERDARQVEDEEKAKARDLVAGWIATARGPLTLETACARWWDEHGQHLADAKIKSALDRIIEILGAKTQLHDIIDDTVSRLVAERRKDLRRDRTIVDAHGRRKILYRPITPTTVNRTVDLLRRVCRRAVENWNARLPNQPVWKKHRLKETKRPVRELLPSEEAQLDEVESVDYAELRRLAIVTGLRLKTLILTWPQVDFELGVIRVRAKGGVWRTIPMTKEIYAMLWRRRGHHPEFVFTAVCTKKWRNPRKPDDVRIPGQRYPITTDGFSSHKDRAWSKAGVSARIHDLRHTTGMRTLRKTRNLKAVQKLLGHTDIRTTAQFYTDALVEDLRQAMEEASAPAPAIAEGKRESAAKEEQTNATKLTKQQS